MNPARYKIALRISHPNMDPEDISTQLHLSPSRKWKAGTPRTTPAGKRLAGTNRETYCVFDLDEQTSGDLVETLSAFTKKLLAFKPFLHKIQSTGGGIEYFVGLFVKKNAGITIDKSLMVQLLDLGIELSLDIYDLPNPKKVTR